MKSCVILALKIEVLITAPAPGPHLCLVPHSLIRPTMAVAFFNMMRVLEPWVATGRTA